MLDILIITFVTAFALVALFGHIMVAKALLTRDTADLKSIPSSENAPALLQRGMTSLSSVGTSPRPTRSNSVMPTLSLGARSKREIALRDIEDFGRRG